MSDEGAAARPQGHKNAHKSWVYQGIQNVQAELIGTECKLLKQQIPCDGDEHSILTQPGPGSHLLHLKAATCCCLVCPFSSSCSKQLSAHV